jgi:dolichyl-phosphate beta-glucosyltransferase
MPSHDAPFLSVVVPAFNEAEGIGTCLARLREALPDLVPSWEILVADDGSTDDTRGAAAAAAGGDPRVRVLALPHRGKGSAVRAGLLAAAGQWRFMADADLSMPPGDLRRFLAIVESGAPDEILIGSREAAGGVRLDEPRSRYLIGRAFNALVQLVAVPGVRDTQCGFKLLSARAVAAICPYLRTDGFAFDVELLFLARRAGFSIREVGVTWRCRQDSRVALGRGASAFVDVLRVRARAWRGEYAGVPAVALSKSKP